MLGYAKHSNLHFKASYLSKLIIHRLAKSLRRVVYCRNPRGSSSATLSKNQMPIRYDTSKSTRSLEN